MARVKKPKPLAMLAEEDRLEYARRQQLILTKRMEYDACALYLEIWQDMIIQKYDLPDKFDIDLNTGRVTLRVGDGGSHAENGRV